jgi:hypothetical protein
MRKRAGVRKVVDSNDLYLGMVVSKSAEYQTSDTSEAIDCYTYCHRSEMSDREKTF